LTYTALLWWKKASQISVKLQRLACISITGSSGGHTDVAISWFYIEGEAKQATYRQNCSGKFTRARFGHSEVFKKMTNERPSLLAPGDKIVPFIAFGRRFLVKLPPRSSYLSQETSEIFPSNGVIFYTDGSLCEGRVDAGVFTDTLDIRQSYAWLTCYGLPNRYE
jgi:hypothetical protein